MINDKAIKKCSDILLQSEYVFVAYLFGSMAEGQYHENSDLDLAVVTDKNFSVTQYLELISLLIKEIKSDKVDLIWLNKAKPLMKYEVIKNGRVLFYKNSEILNDFETRSMHEYRDSVYILNRHRRYSSGL